MMTGSSSNRARIFGVLALIVLLLVACQCSTSATVPTRVNDASNAVKPPDRIHFEERKQVARAEELLDQPGRIYFVYFFTETGDLLDTVTCDGRPNSSTESLEPNEGQLFYSIFAGSRGLYPIPFKIDEPGSAPDTTFYTEELMGRDGTFGEAVPYLYCVTPVGNYEQWSPYDKYRISDIPKNYGQQRARVDADLLARKLRAEEALRRGQCVDNELNIIDCAVVRENINPSNVPTPQAVPTMAVPGGPTRQP